MPTPSLESLELTALDARAALCAQLAHAWLGEATSAPRVSGIEAMRTALSLAAESDVALGLLFAETVALADTVPAIGTLARHWRQGPIALPAESPIGPTQWLGAAALERNGARRARLTAHADAAAVDHFAPARDAVRAQRETLHSLRAQIGARAFHAVGLAPPDDVLSASNMVLEETRDAFDEVDPWIRARSDVVRRGPLAWSDRLATFSLPRATSTLPLADRLGIASRWFERIGLGTTLARVRDESSPAAPDGCGTIALRDAGIDGARIVGAPSQCAWGVMQLSSTLGEAIALVSGREPRGAARLGVDRIGAPGLGFVGAAMLADERFLHREAGVDRSVCADVRREFAYAMIAAIRVHAALATFQLEAMAGEGDLPVRFHDAMTRALGDAPLPVWAAQLSAALPVLRFGPRTIAATIAPGWLSALRDAHDDDWFRNPRAGAAVRQLLDAARALGVPRSHDDAAALDRDRIALRAWLREITR